ncbi:MAG: cytochrome-c peroxidase [Sandaracinaceae bacterium]|nr:cytochrome-c peroxidase [Sandaracinaceae bacterium]
MHLVDASAYSPLRVVALGAGTEPYGVIADPNGLGFVVSLRGSGEIAMLEPTGELGARTPIGPEPRGLAMNARGHLLATRWRSSNEGASVYALSALVPAAFDGPPSTVTLGPDVGLDSDTDNDGVLSFLDQIVLAPDGERAVIPALKANVVAGLFRSGAPLTSQTTARAVLGEVSIDRDGAARESFRHSFDDLDAASAAVFSPWGDLVYVAMRGAQAVVIADAFDLFTVSSIPDAGEAPEGLALSADGTRLFVHAFLSRSVREYDVSDPSRTPVLVGEAITTTRDPLPPEVLEGKRIFYRSRDPRMSRTSYLACASCHLDGEGDSLVWDFTQRGEGAAQHHRAERARRARARAAALERQLRRGAGLRARHPRAPGRDRLPRRRALPRGRPRRAARRPEGRPLEGARRARGLPDEPGRLRGEPAAAPRRSRVAPGAHARRGALRRPRGRLRELPRAPRIHRQRAGLRRAGPHDVGTLGPGSGRGSASR